MEPSIQLGHGPSSSVPPVSSPGTDSAPPQAQEEQARLKEDSEPVYSDGEAAVRH